MPSSITIDQLKKHNLICRFGEQVGVFAGEREGADAYCAAQAELTGDYFDWYTSAGRIVATTLPRNIPLVHNQWYWIFFVRKGEDVIIPAVYSDKETFHTAVVYDDPYRTVEHIKNIWLGECFVLKKIH